MAVKVIDQLFASLNFAQNNPPLFILFLTDKNECELYATVCEHGSCTNTEGSYECQCNQGFKQTANKRGCVGKEYSSIPFDRFVDFHRDFIY